MTSGEFDELVRADIAAFIGMHKDAEQAEQPEEASPIEEITPEMGAETADAADALGFGRRYRRSFLSRYIQSGEEVQERYNVIKNELLSYQRVKARTSWRCETFKQAKTVAARINVIGKTLYLYLALTPDAYLDKQGVSDASTKYADTPLLIKIKSERACKRAVALVAEMMGALGAARIEREIEDFRAAYENDEALLARGLIKPVEAEEALPVTVPVVALAEEALPTAEEPGTAEEIATVTEESPATDGEITETNGIANDLDDDAWTTELGVWKPADRTVVHLAEIDFNDAEFAHEVTGAMIDAYGVTLQAVVVEKMQFVDRTCLRLVLQKMPRATRRRLRVRTKNLVYRGKNVKNGLLVPYTAQEYAALKGSERKQVLEKAALLKAYDITRGQLAAIRILKSTDMKMIEKFKKLEASLIKQAEPLLKESGWRELVRE